MTRWGSEQLILNRFVTHEPSGSLRQVGGARLPPSPDPFCWLDQPKEIRARQEPRPTNPREINQEAQFFGSCVSICVHRCPSVVFASCKFVKLVSTGLVTTRSERLTSG